VWKYVSEPGRHPQGARQMAIRLYVLPDEGNQPPPEDD